MIQEGQQKKAKYWGKFMVKKVSRLNQPIACYSDEIGEVFFNPTLVKIEWEKSPSENGHEFWFPYWVTIKNKEKYGQFAPMMGEGAFLELLRNSIKQDFFSDAFLRNLGKTITEKISPQ